MKIKQFYNDVWGSIGGADLNYKILYKLLFKNRFSRVWPLLKNEVFYGRVSNAIKRQKNKDIFTPKSIVLEPTFKCNLSCKQCYAPNEDIIIDPVLFQSILTQARELGIYRYVLMGGEPTLKEVRDVILPVIRKNTKCSFLFCTNGIGIDEEFINDFKKVKNTNFFVSVEGLGQYVDERRGQGNYQKLLKGIKLLKKNHLPFALSVTLNANSWKDQIPEEFFADFAKNGGFVMYTYFIFDPESKSHAPINRVEYLDYLHKISRKYNIYIGDGQFGKLSKHGVIPRKNNQVCINPYGIVRFDRFVYEPVFGDLNKEKFRDILAKQELKDYHKKSKELAMNEFSGIEDELSQKGIKINS
jgi:MoaA/NifB/PqqE/SkfB family radical SAM enzyme